jgi:arylsulfatase A-like enzyme
MGRFASTPGLILVGMLAACTGSRRPPVLWIVLDTVSAGHLALYGGRARMPAVEAFARDALVFESAWSNFPETQFSHWSMFTGVMPEAHGNIPAFGTSGHVGPTVAELLGGRAWATAAFIGGATLDGASSGLDRGFDHYDDEDLMAPPLLARPALDVSTRARDWIAGAKRPWFVFAHFFDAHFPYMPSNPGLYDPRPRSRLDGTHQSLAPYRDFGAPMDPVDLAHIVALYDAEITEMDRHVGDLLARLRGDEIVILTADHGESFEHGYLFNHRAVLYDSVLHVPLIIKAPGVEPGRARERVELLDLYPTLLTLLDLSVETPLDGRSLLEKDPGRPGRFRLAPLPEGERRFYSRTDPWLEGALLGLRTDEWKLIWNGDALTAFDLRLDPEELRPAEAPAALLDGPRDYAGKLGLHAPFTRPLPPRRPPADRPPPDPRAQDTRLLEQLGYVERPSPQPAP